MKKKPAVQLTSIANRIGNEQLLFNTYSLEDISSKSLYVCQSGVKSWMSPGWISGPAIYDHYILHYIVDGKGCYFCGEKEYPLSKGDMFLIKPYTEVYYQADHVDPYRYYWVGFHGTESLQLLLEAGFHADTLVVHCEKQEDIIRQLKAIASIRSWSPSHQYQLIGYLYQIFASLISGREKTELRSSRYYYNAVAFIRKNAHLHDLSVEAVASHVGIDRTTLYRVFQNNSQSTVKEFIISVRLEKAKLFLKNTSHSIEEVAGFSGFSDFSYFSQTFRHREGCTPSQYRRLNANPALLLNDEGE